MSGAVRVVASKLVAVPSEPSFIRRARLSEALSRGGTCVLVCAMTGYGKSVAVRHWLDDCDHPVAWLNVDRLDNEPTVFWTHFLTALAAASAEIDTEPVLILHERGIADRVALSALIAELHSVTRPVTIVLDGLDHLTDRRTLDDLALVVERCHEQLRLVITSSSDPALPLGLWRSSGWLTEIREDELRLTDDEATALGRALDRHDEEWLRALNHLVDGWPVAFRIAVVSEWRPEPGEDRWLASERPAAAELASRLLARMDQADRDAALALSVFDEFDPMLCLDLLGAGGSASVRRLIEQGDLISVLDPATGTMRLRPLMRQLLEAELGWRDPVRRAELHRRAAELWKRRGDLRAAHRHLATIGETERSRELLVDAAFDIVDAGDVAALRDLAARLPMPGEVDDHELALELGAVAAWGDGTAAATRWCERAEELHGLAGNDERATTERSLGARGLRCMIAALDGDLRTVVELAESMPYPLPRLTKRIDAHVAFAVARGLVAVRHRLADEWIRRARATAEPPIVRNAIIPSLESWCEWLAGRLDTARELSEQAVRWIDDHHIEAHHWAIDTFVTAGWCRLSAGDLVGARELADRSVAAAAVLPGRWNQLQATYLAARLALAEGDARGALNLLDDLQGSIPFDEVRPYADRLTYVATQACIVIGRIDQASVLASGLTPGVYRQLVRARIEPLSDARLEAVLEERRTWPVEARVQAEVILATRATSTEPPPRLVEVVSECARTGWVLPFLGLGPRAERVLRSLPLQEIHPALDEALHQDGQARHATSTDAPELTARERALIELLPTHLSYAEMGQQLYLSVNTVKSSLKVLYRKLGAHTRAEAVAAGRAFGLI